MDPTNATVLSRRALFAGLLVPVLAVSASAASSATAAASGGVATAEQMHILRRLTYGPTTADRADIATRGTAAWIASQLHPDTLEDGAGDDITARFPAMGATPGDVRDEFATRHGNFGRMRQLGSLTVGRAAWSRRQLNEIMVDVFSNHLNVTNPSTEVWDNRAHYDTTVIRAHALGRYADMIVASTMHPAMLSYLGADQSTKKVPNENLGRELLELHTVGVGAGYTETEMRSSSLLLTGLGKDPKTGDFQFHPTNHFVGPVSILGFTHPNDTAAGGLDAITAYLTYLARHPGTATNVARTIAVRFVSDDPSDALVGTLATIYRDHDTAIVPVLEALFTHPEFLAATGVKLRRPYEDLIGAVRALGIGPDSDGGVRGIDALYRLSDGMYNAPMGWHPPNGYPDVASEWLSPALTLARWNMRTGLVSHTLTSALTNPTPVSLLGDRTPRTYGDVVDALSVTLFGRTVPEASRRAVCTYVSPSTTPDTPLTGTSDRWSLPALTALLLTTPDHTTR